MAARLPANAVYPEGLLLRVLPPDRPFPRLEILRKRLRRALAALGEPATTPVDAWSRHYRFAAAVPIQMLADAHRKAGDAENAAQLTRLAAALRSE